MDRCIEMNLCLSLSTQISLDIAWKNVGLMTRIKNQNENLSEVLEEKQACPCILPKLLCKTVQFSSPIHLGHGPSRARVNPLPFPTHTPVNETNCLTASWLSEFEC